MTLPFNNPNSRVFYACQAVFVEERDTEAGNGGDPTTATYLDGVQAVGVSSNNPANSLVDIGRHQRKYTQYGQQTIEITLERVINKGSNFFYFVSAGQYTTYQDSHFLHANNFGSKGAADDGGKVLRNYDITILYGPDGFSRLGSGPLADADKDNVISVSYLNCLITSINYSLGVDGIRESISLTTKNLKFNDDYADITQYTLPSFPESGNIIKRSDFDLTQSSYGQTKLPTEIKQLFNFDTPVEESGLQVLGIQSVNIDVSVDYTTLADVGIWRGSENTKEYEQNRWTIVNLPISITCSFTGTLRQSMPYYNFLNSGENKVRNVDNIYTKSLADGTSTDWQEADREIKLVALGASSPQDYFVWDLGKKNYLSSIEYNGGGEDGSNVEATINYTNQYSDFVVTKTSTVLDLTNNGPY